MNASILRTSLLLGLGLSATGCVRASTTRDVSQVRELSRVERIAQVADVDVDPLSVEDVRRLLDEPLDADAAVRIALLNNRELRATLRELGVARGRLLQAGLLPNPVVEFEVMPERNSRFELRVEYDITGLILAPLRSRAASHELAAARQRTAAAVVELGYRVRVAFYRFQSVQQRLGIAQRVLDALAAGRDASRAMFNAGNVAELDLATQEAAYERARIRVALLELEVLTERERLQRLLGLHGEESAWQVSGELAAVPTQHELPEDLETRVLSASLELGETRERLEGLARRAGVARTEGWLPDLNVDLHGLHGDPEAPMGSSRSWRFGGGVSVGVPLFNRGQGAVAALNAEFDALMERYYGLAITLRSAAREARARVVSAHARARQFQEVIVPAQARVTEQTLLQYNAMQIGIYPLLAARREELDAHLAYVDTLREYWSAVAELDALLAGKYVTADAPAASGMGGMGSMGDAASSAGGH